jgi:membrane protein DedA with SNARE-associated domain
MPWSCAKLGDVSSHEIQHLLHQYGCGLVFAVVALQALGAPLPGTTALIAAALYAATSHGLPIVGVLAGVSGMPVGRFFTLSAAAATAWALINGLEYYWFGDALAGADAWVQVVLVCVGIAWLGVSLTVLRRRALRRIRAASALIDAK